MTPKGFLMANMITHQEALQICKIAVPHRTTAQQRGVQGDQYSQGQAHMLEWGTPGHKPTPLEQRWHLRESVSGLIAESLKPVTNSPACQRRVRGAK